MLPISRSEHDAADTKDDQQTNPIIFVQHRPPQQQLPLQARIVQTFPQHPTPVRSCEFCGSSNTPTWRRGPAGKASLCNACGIKWRLRKRMKKGGQSPSMDRAKPMSPKKKSDPARRTIFKTDRRPSSPVDPSSSSMSLPSHIIERGRRKHYYCKYCKQTWAISHFKNSQQFGAHCSNCSRRPANGASDTESMEFYTHPHEFYGSEVPYYLDDEDEHKVPLYRSASPSSPPLTPPRARSYGGALAMVAGPPSPDALMVPSSPDNALLGLLTAANNQLEDEDSGFAVLTKAVQTVHASLEKHHAALDVRTAVLDVRTESLGTKNPQFHNDLQHLANIAEDVRVHNYHYHNAVSSRFSRVPRYD